MGLDDSEKERRSASVKCRQGLLVGGSRAEYGSLIWFGCFTI